MSLFVVAVAERDKEERRGQNTDIGSVLAKETNNTDLVGWMSKGGPIRYVDHISNLNRQSMSFT